jgi:hypothetical protein
MDVRRLCKIKEINWGALPELKARLEKDKISIKSCSVSLESFPDSITYQDLSEAANDVLSGESPVYYNISINGKSSDNGIFRCSVVRLRNIHNQECLFLTVDGIQETDTVDSIMNFLGLEPAEYSVLPEKPTKTAFIAHRFDNVGIECADKLARFMELLGFKVVTGRAYSPKSVSSKVRERIENQAIVFAIITPGDDNTWLTQESILSEVRNKPLIILKENDAVFKNGLLADLEYIPFESPRIESGFIAILEGLRELGYFEYDWLTTGCR